MYYFLDRKIEFLGTRHCSIQYEMLVCQILTISVIFRKPLICVDAKSVDEMDVMRPDAMLAQIRAPLGTHAKIAGRPVETPSVSAGITETLKTKTAEPAKTVKQTSLAQFFKK